MKFRGWAMWAGSLLALAVLVASVWPASGVAAWTADQWTREVLRDAPGALAHLPADRRERAVGLARRQSCPCGCKQDVLDCVETDPSCPSRPESASVVGGIAAALEAGVEPPQSFSEPSAEEVGRKYAISVADARRLHDGGAALFLDGRKPEMFRKGHVRGAINVPVQQLDALYTSLRPRLDAAGTIVTYCPRGCSVSAILARALLAKGHRNVRVLAGGWDAWREAGHPVTVDGER